MYKILYTGRDYPEEVESMINAEQYETREQAEQNKLLTMQLAKYTGRRNKNKRVSKIRLRS